jgi:hypothetical protein
LFEPVASLKDASITFLTPSRYWFFRPLPRVVGYARVEGVAPVQTPRRATGRRSPPQRSPQAVVATLRRGGQPRRVGLALIAAYRLAGAMGGRCSAPRSLRRARTLLTSSMACSGRRPAGASIALGATAAPELSSPARPTPRAVARSGAVIPRETRNFRLGCQAPALSARFAQGPGCAVDRLRPLDRHRGRKGAAPKHQIKET